MRRLPAALLVATLAFGTIGLAAGCSGEKKEGAAKEGAGKEEAAKEEAGKKG